MSKQEIIDGIIKRFNDELHSHGIYIHIGQIVLGDFCIRDSKLQVYFVGDDDEL